MSPTTSRWQMARRFRKTERMWSRNDLTVTNRQLCHQRISEAVKPVADQHDSPCSDQKLASGRSDSYENPVIGILLFLFVVVGIFFGAHWVVQTLSGSLGRFDTQTMFHAILGR